MILLLVGAVLVFIGYGLTPDDQSNLFLGIILVLVVAVSGKENTIKVQQRMLKVYYILLIY